MMRLRDIYSVLHDAAVSDYVVAGFFVASPAQASEIVNATATLRQPIGIRFEDTTHIQTVIGRCSSDAPVIFQAAPTSRQHAYTALEEGVLMLSLSDDLLYLRKELQDRGAFLEIPLSHVDKVAQCVYVKPQFMQGAFTGNQYLINTVDPISQGWRGVVTMEVEHPMSHHYLRRILHLPVSQILFDVRRYSAMAAAGLAAEYLSVLGNTNTATMYSH